MGREGIYVGIKEITQRYVGTRLVWEKRKLLFSGNVPVNYDSRNGQIILHKGFSQKNVKLIEINGQQISVSRFENRYDKTFITFAETAEEFERKTGFNRYRSYYGSVPIKIFGG